MSSTDDLCLGNKTPIDEQKRTRKKSSGSASPASSQLEVDLDVQEEIDELLENVEEIRNNFTVINKIGSGTFSSVYVAKLKNLDVKQMFALKYLIPTSHPSRIENELKCLQQIGGVDNVMGVKACLRQRDHIVIVMPYFPHERFQDYVWCLSVSEVREYMKALLVSLRRVHSVDIIHRDVKPSNFLYNSKIKQYALVDFGLAQKAPVAHISTNQTPLNKSTPASTNKGTESSPKPEDDSSRKTRSSLCEQTTKPTQQKRKHSDNQMENSPQKKHRINSTESPENPQKPKKLLAEIDMNVPNAKPSTRASDIKKQQEDLFTKSTTTKVLGEDNVISIQNQVNADILPKSLFDNPTTKDKSLRANVLRKSAMESLDPQKGTGLQISAPGVGVDKLGKHQAPSQQRQSCTVVVSQGGKQMYKSVAPSTCDCYGKPQICTMCMARSSQHAPRAGTPGFRAPEVLLKCPDQTTAVDIWSAGVIFLSLMTGRYPFFKAPDDITALAQIIALFGTKKVQRAAMAMGKNLICNPEQPGISLKQVCYKLRAIPENPSPSKTSSTTTPSKKDNTKGQSNDPESILSGDWDKVPDDAFDLLSKLLEIDPVKRMTADQALQHSFFSDMES